MPERRVTFKSARPHVLALSGFLLLTLLMTYPLVLNLTTAIPGDGFDGWQNYWNLWWVKTAVLDLHQSPYSTTYLYYPTGYSLLFHTLNIFNSLLSLPIQLCFGLTASYNFVVLFSFVLGGYGTYLLALYVIGGGRRTRDHLVAFLAGAVFTFSPFHFAHLLGHMQVISVEWLPFYVLALVKSLSSARMRPVSHVGLPVVFFVLSALCDWYFVLYLLVFTVLYLAYRAWADRRPRSLVSKTGLVLVVSGIVLSPLLVPMIREALQDPSHLLSPFETTVRLSADLLAFITPNEFHPLWGEAAASLSEAFTSSTSERMVFAGYITLALAGYALWTRRRAGAFWAVSCLTFFLISLGPYLHIGGREVPLPLPYLALYRFLPFFRIARSVSRFDVMVMLSLAPLVALGLQRLLAPLPATRARVLAVVATALVCLEFLPAPYPMTEVYVPSFYHRLAADEDEYAILELPMNWDRPAHLLYQTVHHKPIIAGYVTRPNPLSLVERVPVLQHFRFLGSDIIAQDPAEVAPEVLAYLDIKYAILHGYMLPPGKEREANFALVEEVFGDQLPAYEDGQITVYGEAGREPRTPLLVLGPDWGERQMIDGQPARELGLEATCAIIAPVGQEVRLTFAALSGGAARPLLMGLDGQMAERYEVAAEVSQFETGPLPLAEGANILRIRDEGEGEPTLVFTTLDVDAPP
jgi:hypothetical protein